ncbi:hypothetical protein, partial [Auritidibacter ignavus]|uniref:hypothetical protein n=1 Tax=Auritidibacter ignavus TaxID=678932 RepID=UPI0015D65D72
VPGLGEVLLDQPLCRGRDPLPGPAGGAAGELRDQPGGHPVDFPSDVPVFPAVDLHPVHPHQGRGVVGEERVEVSQVLFRLSRWENLDHAKEV